MGTQTEKSESEEISQFGVVKGVKVGNRFGVYQHSRDRRSVRQDGAITACHSSTKVHPPQARVWDAFVPYLSLEPRRGMDRLIPSTFVV